MTRRTVTLVAAFSLLLLQAIRCQENKKCGELEFFFFDENTGFINENDFVNISFWINTSECEEPNEEYYILESQTKTNKGRLEYDGRIVLWNKSCTVILEESIRCTTETGPAELYRKVNRSHTEIEFLWSWKEYKTKQLRSEKKPLKLNVSYPSSATNLTADGYEIGTTYLIDENQEVKIECLFDKGNPSVTFRLLDESGRELKLAKEEGHLTHRLVGNQCEHHWKRDQSLRCEGMGSKHNRSVVFLVRCPPRFAENLLQLSTSLGKNLTLALKSHTKDLEVCKLTSLASGDNSSKEANCSLSGNPPDLMLTIHMDKEDESNQRSWSLTVQNEKGTANVTLVFLAEAGDSKIHTDSSTSFIIIIGGGAGGGFVLIIIIIIVVVKCRKSRDVNIQSIASIAAEKQAARKSDSSAGTGAGAAGNDSKSGGSSARSSSSGSDKPSSNPNYTSTALQEVEIHAYMDLHTRDPTYAATASKKDNHTYIELRTKRMQSEPPQPPAEGSRNSAIYANQGRSPKTPVVEEEEEDETNYYNTA